MNFTTIANENITAQKVRLVHNDVVTVLAVKQALKVASDEGLDLIQINDEEIPVVKVMDLNKYNYSLKQSKKEAQKKQRLTATKEKEIQINNDIQENDLNVKMKSIMKFIESGKNVRIVMKVKGRQVQNQTIVTSAKDKLQGLVDSLGNIDVLQPITSQGRNIVCVIKPKS